ncbi:MAG: serine hydrolase domain-containing protein, partial [Pseudomonadales bacterium]
ALQLVDQGKLDLDAPVMRYWPEFAANGKQRVLVRHLLNHRAGLPAIWQEVDSEVVFDATAMAKVLQQEAPYWEPGSAQGYHVFTFGWLVGELIKRVSDQSVGAYFARHIGNPLGLQCYIGLTQEQLTNIADVKPRPPRQVPQEQQHGATQSVATKNPASKKPRQPVQKNDLAERAFSYPPSLLGGSNSTKWRCAEIPAANGHANAHALARVYAALANNGELDGVRLLSEKCLALCATESSYEVDRVLGVKKRFSLGFSMISEPAFPYGRGRSSFGHAGHGGSIGFADPEYGLSMAYVTNRLGVGLSSDRRALVLCDAAYDLLVKPKSK